MSEARASKSFAVEGRTNCSDGALSPYLRVARGESAETSIERRGYITPLLWLNLVCLDAPMVAVSWQWLFARTFNVPLSWANSAALFLTAWLIYLADRLGDSVSLPPGAPCSRRQEFCAQHRKAWIWALGVVAIADACLIATRLEFPVLAAGVVTGGAALTYLVLNQRWSQLWRVLPIKEVTIGFLFAAGTMVALLHGLTISVLPVWFLFASLCSLNCVSIAVWERELDCVQGRASLAQVFPGIGRVLGPPLLILAAVCFAFAFAAAGARAVYLCLATSALLLAGLNIFRNRIAPDLRTALADLVLLTPLAMLVARAF